MKKSSLHTEKLSNFQTKSTLLAIVIGGAKNWAYKGAELWSVSWGLRLTCPAFCAGIYNCPREVGVKGNHSDL